MFFSIIWEQWEEEGCEARAKLYGMIKTSVFMEQQKLQCNGKEDYMEKRVEELC